ncbi:lantibiotic dehydratase [Geothrix terrae]|uniref:lantibiotic dehydratase n=1 Tax=Geothrix terrae TaxID=2922720 RepID=UPI001FAD68D1|nr:lantibiotic dehydratase [Geothrix terrae]
MPQTSCQTTDFFVLRSPGLPLDALAVAVPPPQEGLSQEGLAWEGSAEETPEARLERDREALRAALRAQIRQPAVREAVALASADLAARLDAWLEGALDDPATRGVERALVKYLSRMSSRATPFGLFAGVSTGAWGAESRLAVESWRSCRKAVRLDWAILEALVDRLEGDPEVRSRVTYRPNSSLYAWGGWRRYLETRDTEGKGRSYHLEAVEATPHLEFALQQARAGQSFGDLAVRLAVRLKVELAEARTFLEQVVEAQVLRGDLHPPLTSPDPLGHVIAALRAHTLTAPQAEPLVALGRDLDRLRKAPLGACPEGYPAHLPSLQGLDLPPGTRDILQVDLFRPAPGLALSTGVRRALEEGADTLRRLTQAPIDRPLEGFRRAFGERYGQRWMPLLEVLDEESGIGFDGAPAYDDPLLAGLPFQAPAPPRTLSRRDQFLLAQFPRWAGTRVWTLEDADLDALVQPDPQPFPAAFAALATLAASNPADLDRGDFQFWMEQYSGPTAARWLGRFASGDPGLQASLQRHLRKEEGLRPEAVFAEVVHVPEGRMGNVLARPALREYEIPFLATAGVPQDHVIPPSDLQVTVRGDRVVLASVRLEREVIPRLSSAHNFARGPVVYRFLAHLQDQDGRAGGWSWGALAEQPFLPRVVRGRHVLSRARWRIRAEELKAALAASGEGAWGAFQILRERLGLPRFVTLTDADNSLRVDLDRVLWVETLHHLVAGRSAFTLTECFPDAGQTPVTSPEGPFAHELVIPFEAASAAPPRPVRLPPAPADAEIRAYPPGSEWLYLKLYGGAASGDRLLVALEPLLRWTRAQGFWDRWHFIRYRDPEPHLRLRFHGLPLRLLTGLLPEVHRHLEGCRAQGLLWKWQVDTFEPELERYGGPRGFDLAEAWFFEDSERILSHLLVGLGPKDRWKAGLRQVDAIWAALGLDDLARRDLSRGTRDALRKEFEGTGPGVVAIGARFRQLRKDLEAELSRPSAAPDAFGLRSLAAIREACDQGQLREDRTALAGSLAHMHLNRLFRTHPREQEWILMEFLARLYESRLARPGEGGLAPGPESPGVESVRT